MPRAKSKKNLTPEAKQAQAFVPLEEQPYEVPENWRWVRLQALSIIISKGTTPSGGKSAYTEHGVNFLRVENILDDGTISHDKIAAISEEIHFGALKRSILEAGDILVSIAGTLGRIGIVRKADLPINTNQAICFIRLLPSSVLHLYLKLFLETPAIQRLLLSKTKVTAIPNLTLEIISNCPVALPPLDEQQRIVDRVERLFAALDAAREKAQAVLAGCETRKAAILHKAFTGELTAVWREAENITKSSWTCLKLKDVADWGSGGTPSRKISEYFTGDIPWVKTGELNDSIIYDTEEKITQSAIANSSAKLFPVDTVLVAMYGATIGKTAILGVPATTNQACACAVAKDNTDYRFLFYYLRSQKNAFIHKSKGGAQPNISQEIIKGYPISLPSVREQCEIVRLLEKLLARENVVCTAAAHVIKQIDDLKRSILVRAFRGELGTNDPAEPPALL